MRHLGDITKISGYTAPIVDCIIGGSPCQDLSVAGKRAGLDGERSGLYMEQIRIVKEMRKRDEHNGRAGVDIRPRYMVWENVPGAFSSNKGEDFRIVLEEIAKVCDKDAVIPMPDKGKWTNHGCIVGDGWSVAWRVLDAQFWGVPQRRRRIALVADFGGQSAPEILFVRKSVSGHTDESKQKGKGTPSNAEGGFGADDIGRVFCFEPGAAKRLGGYVWEGLAPTLRTEVGDNRPSVAYTMQDREGCAGGGKGALIQKDRSAALRTVNSQYLFQPVYSVENHPADSRVDIDESGKVQTLTSRMGTGGGNVPMVMQCYSKSKRAQSATDDETWVESETANTLNAFDVGDVRTTEAVVFALDRASFNQGKNAQFDFEITDKGINSPLVAKGPGAVCYAVDQGGGKSSVDVREGKAPTLTTTHDGAPAVCYSFDPGASRDVGTLFIEECGKTLTNGTCPGHHDGVVIKTASRYIVRRLTPLECERLQGYPDGWTDIGEYIDSNGKKRQASDASRYKALGNSISLPNWKWVLKKICACYERDATMASLFDGIGGFPYLWEQLNGKGTCLWASEIEEFPMAVTKVRIGE